MHDQTEAFIPLSVPHIAGNEWQYVKECLDTGWVSSAGSYVNKFEQMMSEYVGMPHAVAVVNGTAALHTALLVAGVQPHDEVIVSDLTFVAPANAVRYAGAIPVFIGPEADYYQIDPVQVEKFLQTECEKTSTGLINQNTGRRVRAMIPVHVLGHPVDINALSELCSAYDLTLISDATEALGSKFLGRSVASYGDIACLSFNGNKIMTTGGGGMLLTHNAEWAEHARYLTTQAKDDPLEYDHGAIGYNYRLTNIQAALGCAQLEQISSFVAKKRQIAHTYATELRHIPGICVMPEADWAESNYWMYTIRVDADVFGMDSRVLLQYLAQHKIQTRPVWRPMHLLKPHQQSPVYGGAVSEIIYREALSLPCSVGLSDLEQTRVVQTIREAHRNQV